MRRALHISLILYLPLALLAAMVFMRGFPDSWQSSIFWTLFWLWLLDGSAGLVTGIMVLSRFSRTNFSEGTGRSLMIFSGLGILLGLLPAYILVELGLKLFQYFFG